MFLCYVVQPLVGVIMVWENLQIIFHLRDVWGKWPYTVDRKHLSLNQVILASGLLFNKFQHYFSWKIINLYKSKPFSVYWKRHFLLNLPAYF